MFPVPWNVVHSKKTHYEKIIFNIKTKVQTLKVSSTQACGYLMEKLCIRSKMWRCNWLLTSEKKGSTPFGYTNKQIIHWCVSVKAFGPPS